MILLFNRYLSDKVRSVWVSEFILVISAAYFSTVLSLSFAGRADTSSELMAVNTAILSVTYFTLFYCCDLYKPELYRVGRKMLAGIVKATIMAGAVLSIIHYYLHMSDSGYWALLAGTLILPAVFVAGRAMFAGVLGFRISKKKVLIIGSGELAKQIGNEISDWHEGDFDLLGFIDNNPDRFGQSIGKRGVIGGYGDIATIITEKNVTEVIIALPNRRAKLPMAALMACKTRGVSILEGESFHELLTGKITLEGLKPDWLVFSEGIKSIKVRKVVKRMIDLSVSVIVLVITSPIMAIIVLLIKLDSRGPVLISQERVGERGNVFRMCRFRSMTHLAEKMAGPVWNVSNDDRVTRVGRIIRRTWLNELPSLINVIRGDMSFVGPRPERPFFVKQLKNVIPYYEIRSVVKPGITGWAQVMYPYGTSPEDAMEKLRHDIYYIKNMSPFFDLKIIWRSIRMFFGRAGGR